MLSLLADLTRGEGRDAVWVVFVILAVVAFGVAIWRASLRDVLGTLLAGGVGLILLLFAL